MPPALLAAGLLAGMAALAANPTMAAFSDTTQSAGNSLGLLSLAAPGTPTCAWSGTTALGLTWTNTNGSNATGHQVERSNTTGSGFSLLGTTSPVGLVTSTDSSPVPPTLRYYRVAATLGSWIGANSGEVVSNRCSGSIVAFAGGGATTTCNWSGASTSLSLSISSTWAALASDSSGNLYVADTGNNCIRKIDSSGNVTWVAGGGAVTTCNTTTTAANLQLNSPGGVAVDASGNVYVADTGANCVRKIDTSGNVTQVAGGGATTSCNTTTTATAVQLNTPQGLAVDGSGNVYVADSANRCLRKVAGSTVTSAAGNGSTSSTCPANGTTATGVGFNQINTVSLDGSGNLYFTDRFNACMYKASGGTLTRLAGKGGSGQTQASCAFTGDPTTLSYFSAFTPGSVVDSSGRLYFTVLSDGDVMNRACVIRVASSAATQIAGQNGTGTTGDNGPAIGAFLSTPHALALTPAGDLYVADANLIRRVITP